MLNYFSSSFFEIAAKCGVVGAAVGVIVDEETSFFCYGKKGLYGKELVTIDTLFEIGSITKIFTAALLAILQSKGALTLDDPCSQFLPPAVRIPSFEKEEITLRHLATHHSGLPNLPTNLRPKNLVNPYKDYGIGDLYHFLNHYSLTRAPGTAFAYSNVGFGLLGHLLSERMKKPYDALLHESILQPLSMTDTGRQKIAKKTANGHLLGQPVPHWQIGEPFHGAAGLFTTIQDMAKFTLAHLQTPSHFPMKILQECHQRQYDSGPNESIGLGWIITHSKEGDIFWHDGITSGSRAFIGLNPKNRRGIAILANSTQDWLDQFAMRWLMSNYVQREEMGSASRSGPKESA